MNLFLLFLITAVFLPTNQSFSEPIRLTVVPFDGKPDYVLTKNQEKCKDYKHYWKCIDRLERRIISSLEMDY